MSSEPEQTIGFPHILSGAQFTPKLLKLIFTLSQACREQLTKGGPWPDNMRISGYDDPIVCRSDHPNAAELMFLEPSTRTRTSFAHALHNMGRAVLIDGDVANTSLAKGESWGDHLTILLQNHPLCLIIRAKDNFLPHRAAFMAEDYPGTVPGKERYSVVINAGDGTHEHPTQAVLDAFTLYEVLGERMHDCVMLLTGDLTYSRTINSLLLLIANCYPGIKLRIVCPVVNGKNRGPSQEALGKITELGLEHEILPVVNREQFERTLVGVDVVYSTRPQVERWHAAGEEDVVNLQTNITRILQIDRALLDRYPFLLFHPLPHTEEIADDVPRRHERALFFKQASNGVPTRMALLILALFNPEILIALGQPAPPFTLGWAAQAP